MRLLALALHRLLWFVPTLLGLLVVTFVISRVIPADPVALVAGETATPGQVDALRRQLGYDRPLPVQFVAYVVQLVRGDLGRSLYTTRPIADDLAARLPATIELTVVAMVVSVLIGIPLGVCSALWRNSWLDHGLRVITVSGLATLVRFTRAGVLDVMQSNFVLYERAMGLPRALIVWKYILRNALTSTVTQLGLLFGILLAGAVVTEAVFDWPGIGTYAVNSIIRSDYNAVMGFTVWAGTIFIVVNLLVDVAHTLIDPRERIT